MKRTVLSVSFQLCFISTRILVKIPKIYMVMLVVFNLMQFSYPICINFARINCWANLSLDHQNRRNCIRWLLAARRCAKINPQKYFLNMDFHSDDLLFIFIKIHMLFLFFGWGCAKKIRETFQISRGHGARKWVRAKIDTKEGIMHRNWHITSAENILNTNDWAFTRTFKRPVLRIKV